MTIGAGPNDTGDGTRGVPNLIGYVFLKLKARLVVLVVDVLDHGRSDITG